MLVPILSFRCQLASFPFFELNLQTFQFSGANRLNAWKVRPKQVGLECWKLESSNVGNLENWKVKHYKNAKVGEIAPDKLESVCGFSPLSKMGCFFFRTALRACKDQKMKAHGGSTFIYPFDFIYMYITPCPQTVRKVSKLRASAIAVESVRRCSIVFQSRLSNDIYI